MISSPMARIRCIVFMQYSSQAVLSKKQLLGQARYTPVQSTTQNIKIHHHIGRGKQKEVTIGILVVVLVVRLLGLAGGSVCAAAD